MLYEKIDACLSKNDESGTIALLELIPDHERKNLAGILEVSIYKNHKDLFSHILNNYDVKPFNTPHENFFDAVYNSYFEDNADFIFYVQNLMEKDIDIYSPNREKETFIENLVFSDYDNKFDLLDCLLEQGIQLKSNPLKDKTLLVRTLPHKTLFKYLYDNCPGLLDEKSKKGNSFFITAVQNKKYDLVEDMIANKDININQTGYANTSSLLFSIVNQDFRMAQILLNAQADPYVSNEKGLDAFSLQEMIYMGYKSKGQATKTVDEFNNMIKSHKQKRKIKLK